MVQHIIAPWVEDELSIAVEGEVDVQTGPLGEEFEMCCVSTSENALEPLYISLQGSLLVPRPPQ